jgi:hypothetical protein
LGRSVGVMILQPASWNVLQSTSLVYFARGHADVGDQVGDQTLCFGQKRELPRTSQLESPARSSAGVLYGLTCRKPACTCCCARIWCVVGLTGCLCYCASVRLPRHVNTHPPVPYYRTMRSPAGYLESSPLGTEVRSLLGTAG